MMTCLIDEPLYGVGHMVYNKATYCQALTKEKTYVHTNGHKYVTHKAPFPNTYIHM